LNHPAEFACQINQSLISAPSATKIAGPIAHPDSYREVRAPDSIIPLAFVYILFSGQLNKHYIGSTRLTVDERLNQHLTEWYGIHFTKAAADWTVLFAITCQSYRQAQKIEFHIKRMKSSRYINNPV
jgi:putative endonuclease